MHFKMVQVYILAITIINNHYYIILNVIKELKNNHQQIYNL